MDTGVDFNPLVSPEVCKVWLGSLPAADPVAVAGAIGKALDDLPARGSFMALRVLEGLRPHVVAVQEALAGRFGDKLLPLMAAQASALAASVALSRKLSDAYAAGFGIARADTGEYGRFSALLQQRAIAWLIQAAVDHLRARHRAPDELWQMAGTHYATALAAGLAEQPVRDSQIPEGRTSVAATYARGLLIHMVGARSLSAREFDLARQLAAAFERKVLIDPPAGSEEAAKERHRRVNAGGHTHELDVTALARSVGGRLKDLDQGRMFDTPVLQPAPAPTFARALLSKLYGAWCSRSNQRRFPRRHRSDLVFCAVEPELIYGLMKRRRYEAPPAPKVYSHVEVANIFLDASGVPMKDQMHTPESWRQVLETLDCWQTIEESATGLSMQRGVESGGMRVKRGQLIGIRHGPQGAAMMAEIRWAEQTPDGRLEVGLEMLPGLARAGAARYADAAAIAQSAGKSGTTAALMLDHFRRERRAGTASTGISNPMGVATALPEINEDMLNKTGANATLTRYTDEATILLPAGWSREGSMIEFIDGPGRLKLRLKTVASRHGDFERMTFEILT
jgi:hypothetical protein